MHVIKIVSTIASITILAGCASPDGLSGPQGPKVVTSGYATHNGQYAEIGVQFTSPGDFTALFSPKRWSSPMATGGTLSWINPAAWREDQGRTGRILFGQALLVGGVVALSADSGGDGGGNGAANEPPPPEGAPETLTGKPSIPPGIN